MNKSNCKSWLSTLFLGLIFILVFDTSVMAADSFPTVSGVSDGSCYSNAVTVQYSAGASGGEILSAKLNNADIPNDYLVTIEGRYTLTVTNKQGNTTTVEFILDKTAPVVQGIANGQAYNAKRTLIFKDGADGSGIASAKLNNVEISNYYPVTEEGEYSLVVTDKAGNVGSPIAFRIDKTAPSIGGIQNNGMYNGPQAITFSDDSDLNSNCEVNGTSISNGQVAGIEGWNQIEVIDNAGNTTMQQYLVDTTAPAVSGVENGGNYKNARKIRFNDGINGSGILSATLNGQAIDTNCLVSQIGTYDLVVEDKVNNVTHISFALVPSVPPSFLGVTDGAYYNKDVTVTINDGDDLGITSFKVNGVEKVNQLVNQSYTFTAEGVYEIVAQNGSGVSSGPCKFTIDKQKPNVIGFTSKVIWIDGDENVYLGKTYSVNASGTDLGPSGIDPANCTVVKNGAGEVVPNDKFSANYSDESITVTYLSPAGGWYRVYLKDKAGNVSDTCLLFNWNGLENSIVPVVDHAAPSISISEPSKVEAIAGDLINYTVTYSDDIGIGAISLSANDITILSPDSARATVTEVAGQGNVRTITVRVDSGLGQIGLSLCPGTAIDVAGKEVAGITCSSFEVVDTALPLAFSTVQISTNNPTGVYAKPGDSIQLGFTTNKSLAAAPTVTILGKTATVTGSGQSWTATYTVTAGDADGTAAFKIVCKDRFGNLAGSTTTVTDSSNVIADTTAPVSTTVENGKAYNQASVSLEFSDVVSGVKAAVLKYNGSVVDSNVTSGKTVDAVGNYELTLTDNAGNVRVIGFLIDRNKPTITGYHAILVNHVVRDAEVYEWAIVAEGTSTAGIAADGTSAIIKDSNGNTVSNSFRWINDFVTNESYPLPEPGAFKVYLKDKAGNVSDNFVILNWTGGF